MEDFNDNKCRICKMLFCCKSCRQKHESNKHNIFPDCDICVYGKTILKNPSSVTLLTHLQAAHWPLHCTLCKKIFGSCEELLKQCKCPIGYKFAEDVEKCHYSPLQSYNNEHTYDSPPLSALYSNENQAIKNSNLFSTLATSTPMQKGEENNLLEKMQGITPVEYSEIKEGIIKKKRLDSNRSGSPKKVTFSDTPSVEGNRKQNMLKKEDWQNDGTIFSTPSNLGTTFYSITEEVPPENAGVEEINDKQPINQIQNNTPADAKADKNNEELNNQSENSISAIAAAAAAGIKEGDEPAEDNVLVKQEDSATWLSAIDVSTSELSDEMKPIPPKTNLYTPVAPTVGKFKKRQVNVVLPIPVVQKEEINNPVDLPLPEFSTPMPFELNLAGNDESPAVLESDPNVVCKPEENTPSISTIELEDHGNSNQHECSDTENEASLANIKTSIEEDIEAGTVHGRFWSFVNKVTSTIGQGLSRVDESMIRNAEFCLKRSFTESDLDIPPAKRYKLSDVKCRRTIRTLPNIEITRDNTRIVYTAQSMKVFVDKATQTNE